MKKVVALLLTVVMVSMFTAVGFADSEENGNQITVNGKALTSEEKKAVTADGKLFSRFGISPESLEVRNITDEEKIQLIFLKLKKMKRELYKWTYMRERNTMLYLSQKTEH